MNIKDMPMDERPREKMFYKGIDVLSNTELLALIIGYGSRKENALDVSRKILKTYELNELSKKTLIEICKHSGIGIAKASKIAAAFELGRRSLLTINEREDMREPEKVARKYIPLTSKLNQEHLICLFLDSRIRLIKDETIFMGSINSSVVHPREIYNAAIRNHAAAIIVLHNHPSGDPEPSEEDLKFTKQLSAAGKIIGIELLDHIIVTGDRFSSLKEQDLM
ncbi:DNA repair protein RadC [Candidatus Woesearchaeota archaeon]|nr:DNA repair protein RadC [Candidatus Woesearchaeota archaeon]